MNWVGRVVLRGLHPPEEVEGFPPVLLFLEKDGLHLGAENGH